ncbi:hypothetical protein GCM10025859_57780 [Alicyclobacillus fastidiosus]|nr:hypothetical protein GCM10025859_57780 [Alicyclobacillus fastidiosus]
MGKTLFEKIWDAHVVKTLEDGQSLLYIDLHLVHEVTSPQAFAGLRFAGRRVRQPNQTFATMDHNVPTDNPFDVRDQIAKKQIETLIENCREFGVQLADLDSPHQGIVHVIGPELGLTVPGKTIVCGDSHTSTHGAFGALAFGIGTSEVEHVLATQCLWQTRPKTLRIQLEGSLAPGVTSKDVILALIAKYGVNFGTGHVIEFAGSLIGTLTMEQRMTICNMSIEAGARAGLMAPDEKTIAYVKDRPHAPRGKSGTKQWRCGANSNRMTTPCLTRTSYSTSVNFPRRLRGVPILVWAAVSTERYRVRTISSPPWSSVPSRRRSSTWG